MKLKKITELYVYTGIWSWSFVGFWRKGCVDVCVVNTMTVFSDIQTFAALWGAGVQIKYHNSAFCVRNFPRFWKERCCNEYEKSCVVYRICAWFKGSVRGLHDLCVVYMICAWFTWSVRGLHDLCLVYMICAWFTWSVRGLHDLCLVYKNCAWFTWSVFMLLHGKLTNVTWKF
jgi:hypothetical protein